MRVLEMIPDESFEAKSCKDSLRRALRDVWTECNGKVGHGGVGKVCVGCVPTVAFKST